MVVGVHGLVGQPRDQPAAPQQAVLRQRGAQRLALRALADDDGLPPRRGLQQRRQVQRALVGVQPAHKGENFGLRVQPQRTAQLRAFGGDVGDDGGVQPHGHQPGAAHAQGLQLGRGGRRFGVGGRFLVDRQVAPQQKVHDGAHRRVRRCAFKRADLAVKQDAVPPAEAVQPRHAGGVVAHDVHGVGVLGQQHLPAFVKRLRPQRPRRQLIDAHVGLRLLDPGGGGARRRVQHDGARAQRGERPRQAHFLPVIHPLLAGRPAVKLRDDDGFHALPPVVLLTPAPRRARALWAVLSGTARR